MLAECPEQAPSWAQASLSTISVILAKADFKCHPRESGDLGQFAAIQEKLLNLASRLRDEIPASAGMTLVISENDGGLVLSLASVARPQFSRQ
jgi:hypothetical protein